MKNLLKHDGVAVYHGVVFPSETSDAYFGSLLSEIEWKHDEAIMFGRHIITARKVAWYANQAFSYTYSRKTRHALPWSPALRELKQIVEDRTGYTFNSCLCNLYHNGNEGVTWHSDDEKSLKKHAAIASLSFGAERVFQFKHKKSGDIVSIVLEHGSLLIMSGATQTNWKHRLPISKKILEPRINLTFRTMEHQAT